MLGLSRGRTHVVLATLAAAAAFATEAVAAGAAGDADAPIAATANGNALAGGLSFAPADIQAKVGRTVRWTNTDVIAPHTVTEDHGLFDLVGNDVNGTPVSPSGFGPGTAVELVLPAGRISYFCRVHPADMKGVLAVPVTLVLGPGLKPRERARTAEGRRRRAARVRAFQRSLAVTWTVQAPAAGQVFDVERRRGAGPWLPVLTGTTKTSTVVKAGRKGTRTSFRARLRKADDATRATDWSPDATVFG